VTTSVLAFLTLITLRVARGSVLVQVKAENRDAVGAVYDVLAGSLRMWTLWLLAIALFIVAETIIWGRLGLVAGVRRGYRAAREQVHSRRAAREVATAPGPEGAEGAVAVQTLPPDPWYRRVAVGTRAFVGSLELSRRSARLGGYVRDHFEAARWVGIVLGVFILLIWPSPTLTVLIWIGAVVALWIGALVWLRNQATEEEATEEEATEEEATEEEAAADHQGPATVPTVTAGNGAMPEAAPLPLARTPMDGGTPAAPMARRPDGPARELDEPVLSPEVLSSLSGRLDLLVRLGQAHDVGVLTDEEFSREKRRLLSV
jgi:hypothetical protein